MGIEIQLPSHAIGVKYLNAKFKVFFPSSWDFYYYVYKLSVTTLESSVTQTLSPRVMIS